MKNNWNLGSGKPNVIQSLKNKLNMAGYHLECDSKNGRTILNIDTYEHTILCWALEAYNRPKGKWIFVDDNNKTTTFTDWTCSVCGSVFEDGDEYRYCPECGTEMEGFENDQV